jgi:DGQHR domain-containing protein
VDGTRAEAEQYERAVAIIDGQHRFRGLIEEYERDSSLDTDVVILCVHNLSYEEETVVFDVINTTPKRLPKALTEWNKYGITDSKSSDAAQEIRQIAVALGTESDSVWNGRVNLTGTGRDPSKKVTLEGLRRSTENMFKGSPAHLPYREKLELAKLYWKSVSETFPEAWSDQQKKIQIDDGRWVESGSTVKIDGKNRKIVAVAYRLTDLVGVASLAKIAGEILTESRGNLDPKSYIRVEVEKLSEVDWEKRPDNDWTNGQAGFAGQKGTYDALAFLRANGRAPWEDESEDSDQ